MSWSCSATATPETAREVFQKLLEEQPAYQNDGAHKAVMDRVAAVAGEIGAAAPGPNVTLSTSGHVGTSGNGSCSISLSF